MLFPSQLFRPVGRLRPEGLDRVDEIWCKVTALGLHPEPMGSIAKAYDDVLVSNEEERSLGVELRKRLDQTAEKILLVSGHEKLCENHRILRHLIDKRRPFLEPINLLQVEILRRLRENPSNIRLREALLITMNGIAAGMRNTG